MAILSGIIAATGTVGAAAAATLLHKHSQVASGKGLTALWDGLRGVRLSHSVPTYRPPMFLHVGVGMAGVGIPMGNGDVGAQERLILSRMTEGGGKNTVGVRFMDAPERVRYLHGADSVVTELSTLGVDASTLPLVLPLLVREWHYPSGKPVWYHAPTSVLSADREAVVQEVVWGSGAAVVLFGSGAVVTVCGVLWVLT